jgi:hypothetical protein
LHYTHSMPATGFGKSCGHSLGGALQQIYYKGLWTNVQWNKCVYRHIAVMSGWGHSAEQQHDTIVIGLLVNVITKFYLILYFNMYFEPYIFRI